MKKFLLLSSLTVFAFVGCKKSGSSNNSCTLSSSSIVGTYKITAAVLSVSGQTLDVFNDDNYFEPCERDDIHTINANGSYTITDGQNVCTPSSAGQGTWSLNGNSFTMDGTDVFSISDFNCTSFKIVSTETIGGTTATTTISFTRQ